MTPEPHRASPKGPHNQDPHPYPETTRPLALGDLAALPATIDVVTAARALGIGRTKAYQLARDGEFPCPVLHVGNAYRVPTASLLHLLGLTAGNSSQQEGRPR